MKKTKTTNAKLFLNKETVTILNQSQQSYIVGGFTTNANVITNPNLTATITDTGRVITTLNSKTTRDGQ